MVNSVIYMKYLYIINAPKAATPGMGQTRHFVAEMWRDDGIYWIALRCMGEFWRRQPGVGNAVVNKRARIKICQEEAVKGWT